jgi:hypothetical protein
MGEGTIMKHVNERTLSKYLDGELDMTENSVVTEHLERCPQCRETYERLVALSDRLSTLPAVEPSPYFAAQTKRAAAKARVPTPITRFLIPVTAVTATLASLFVGGYLGQSIYTTLMGNGTNGENGYVEYFDVSPIEDYPEGSFGEAYTDLLPEEVNDEG